MNSDIKDIFVNMKRLLTIDKNFDGATELIHKLIGCGGVTQLKDHEGKNLMFFLVLIPDEELAMKFMEALLSKGIDYREKDINKQSIIHYIARQEKYLLLKQMLELNYNLNENDYFNQTPLFYSAKFNLKTDVAELLIRYGCDVNHKDNNGQTCLYYAAAAGNLDICKLLVAKGCNIFHQDKSRQKAINYAKKYNQTHIIDYLAQFKPEGKKLKDKEDKKHPQSTLTILKDRKKKQITKHHYFLTYTNQNGEVHVLTVEEIDQFKQVNEEYQRFYQIMTNPEDELSEANLPAVQDKKFERIALKIMNHFWKQENSYYFYEPVNFVGLGLIDYPVIIKYPMDFGTIKTKLTYNAYENELEFRGDMNLVFDNCILYNGTLKQIGKIALQMKMEFNTMFIKEFCS